MKLPSVAILVMAGSFFAFNFGCSGTRNFVSLDTPTVGAPPAAQIFVAEKLDPVDIDAVRGGDGYGYIYMPGLVGNPGAKLALWPYENGPFAGPRAGVRSQETKGANLPDGPLSHEGGVVKIPLIMVDELGFVCGNIVDQGMAYYNPLDFDNWWRGVPFLPRPDWTGTGVAESPGGRHLVFYGLLAPGSYSLTYHESILNKKPPAAPTPPTPPAGEAAILYH